MNRPNQSAGFIRHGNEHGGTILGFVLGLGAGLGIALIIAFYLSKNTPQERPGVRAPNLPLTIKPINPPAEGEATAPAEQVDLNKPLQGKSSAVSAPDPIADLANGKKPAELTGGSAKADGIYFLQAGAFTKRPDADAQKANLAIQGIQSQLSEVTADGNTIWRVRIGPFNNVDETNPVRDKLNAMGIKPTVIKSSKS